MKKVLFSSVCAVALLGSNVYAIESNSVGNSLETFLSQKTELENKINTQKITITQKEGNVSLANEGYSKKYQEFLSANKGIESATLVAGDKEGLKNTAEREHASIVNQGNILNTQKQNLDSQLAGINDLINKQNTTISDLTSQIATSQTNVETKKKIYDDLVAQLKPLTTERELLLKEKEAAEQALADVRAELNLKPDDEALKKKVADAIRVQEEANLKVKMNEDEFVPLTSKKDAAHYDFITVTEQHNDLVFKKRDEEKNLETYKSNLTLKQQEIQAHEQKIADNLAQQIQAKTKVDEAMKVYNEALAAVETAKQNQASVKAELDAASLALTQAQNELNTANQDLAKLEEELKNLQSDIANNTEVGKKSKEEMGENYKASTQELANKLITLSAENNGDLSTATPEVKAQAQAIANEIASVIINEQKSEISSDVLSSLNVSINNMNKRLGEIRGLNEDLGVWFRAYGGRFSNDNSHFNYYSTQIGADKKTDFNNGDLIAGALFGYDKVNSNAKSKGFNIGGYLSYISNEGYFADLVLKYIHTGYDKAGIKSQNSFLASVESGYRFNVYQNTYLEPSLELITGYVGKYEAQIGKNTISTKSYVPLIIKPQVFAGYSVNDFTFRAGVGAILDTKKHTANILINDLVKGINASSSVKLDSNNRGFVSLGGSYKFNDNLRLNLSVERSFGSSLTNDYEINSTIRYTF